MKQLQIFILFWSSMGKWRIMLFLFYWVLLPHFVNNLTLFFIISSQIPSFGTPHFRMWMWKIWTIYWYQNLIEVEVSLVFKKVIWSSSFKIKSDFWTKICSCVRILSHFNEFLISLVFNNIFSFQIINDVIVMLIKMFGKLLPTGECLTRYNQNPIFFSKCPEWLLSFN